MVLFWLAGFSPWVLVGGFLVFMVLLEVFCGGQGRRRHMEQHSSGDPELDKELASIERDLAELNKELDELAVRVVHACVHLVARTSALDACSVYASQLPLNSHVLFWCAFWGLTGDAARG